MGTGAFFSKVRKNAPVPIFSEGAGVDEHLPRMVE